MKRPDTKAIAERAEAATALDAAEPLDNLVGKIAYRDSPDDWHELDLVAGRASQSRIDAIALLAWVEHLEGALGKIATGHAGKEMEPYECCTCCDEYAVSVLNRDE